MSLKFILLVPILLLSLDFSSWKVYGEQPKPDELARHSDSHVVLVRSLLPSTVCNRSPKGNIEKSGKVTLEVVNKYGPCSKLSQGKATTTPYTEILLQDRLRVNLIHSRRRNHLIKTQAITTPTISANNLGTANYLIEVGLGTPTQDVSLIVDTGSAVTWTQCQPCFNGCYRQLDPVFNPSKSKSYTNYSCNSSFCSQFHAVHCSADSEKTCVLDYSYLDGASFSGPFAKEKFSIESLVTDFIMVCAHNTSFANNGQVSGIMGLNRNRISFISQTSHLHKNYFSYCLPSFFGSGTGYISFGKTSDFTNKVIKFTPITTDTEYYDIEITGLSVAGHKLPIDSQVFKKAGGSIDSGTVMTYMPPAAYAALRSAFRKKMSKYKMVKPSTSLDTCYDFSIYDTVTIPKVSIYLKGGVELELDVRGIVYPVKVLTEVCLAFVGNPNEADDAILGNTQQQGMEVHYDVAGKRIGFGARGC